MNTSAIRTSIVLVALLTLSACATQEPDEYQTEVVMQCPTGQTLTCDEFAGETHNCSCEKGGNLRDMLDAYSTPDF